MSDKLLTPDAPTEPAAYRQYILTIPIHSDLERFVWGALYGISFLTAWKERGTMSADEASQAIKAVIASRQEFTMLGVILPVIRESLHPSMLICDGTVYNKSDYPQLWDVWPLAMKDATTLTLPDLRSKFLLGASEDYLQGTEGGVAEVVLEVGQLPAHTHDYLLPTFNVDVESVGVPDPTGVGQPAVSQATSSVGNDEPHENMPPYYAVVYAVVAKVSP